MENNNTTVLQEIQELKMLLAKMIGTADHDIPERFSEAALDQAAKTFLTAASHSRVSLDQSVPLSLQ